MVHRSLRLSATRSCFLFGPRQTGKSTLVKAEMGPADLYINLLPQRDFIEYSKDPGKFRQEVLAHHKKHRKFTCVIDEVQKVPGLLDEVHDLIEQKGLRFVLTGSSARKLKRGGANLLAGRANTYHLFPLTTHELGDHFDLERALRLGRLPYLWNEKSWNEKRSADDEREFLRAYADTYLREEIQEEGIVRNIGSFGRFLDIAASQDGEIVNYSAMARETGVSVKTTQEYYRILEDTFLAFRLDPWTQSARKRLVAHPRFYFFDTGVSNALNHLAVVSLDRQTVGRRFEQLMLLELLAKNEYERLDLQFFYWRTNTGAEVDLLLVRGQKIVAAVEVKSTNEVSDRDAAGLRSFADDHPKVPRFIIAPVSRERILTKDDVHVVPWRRFIEQHVNQL